MKRHRKSESLANAYPGMISVEGHSYVAFVCTKETKFIILMRRTFTASARRSLLRQSFHRG